MLHTFDNAAKQNAGRRERERQLVALEQLGTSTVDLLRFNDWNLIVPPLQESKRQSVSEQSWLERFKWKRVFWSSCGFAVMFMSLSAFGQGFEFLEAQGGLTWNASHQEDNIDSNYKRLHSTVLEWGFTSQEALDDADSPQARALRWLSDDAGVTENLEVIRTRFSLATIYFSTNFINLDSGASSWYQQSFWMSHYPVCLWHGVRCVVDENSSGRVESLNLSSNGLAGYVPQEIALLQSDIRILDLGNNAIEGTIPEAIANLINLGK
jgi:hypothetical protein